jgi:FdhD protein
MSGRTARRRVLRIALPDQAVARADLLAADEPLGIRIGGQAVTLTMRTPGDDIDLAAGFLVGEGVVRRAGDIVQIRICTADGCGHSDHDGDRREDGGGRGGEDGGDTGGGENSVGGNIADVTLGAGVTFSAAVRRNFLTTSACGVCGKASIHDLAVLPDFDLSADRLQISAAVLARLPDRLRAAQRVFASTGGLHAAGLFGADGELLVVREDVGRHNAVDKVVGWALRQGRLPLAGCVLLVSGRASFELVQKAVMAGIPVLAAVSAPSSLAAELAAQAGLTLVGFLRGSSMNVYTGEQRIAVGEPEAAH